MPTKTRDIRPVSVSPRTAARMLDVGYDFVLDLVTRGVFTVLAPDGRGIGKRIYLHTDEVEKYGETRDELAVRNLRVEQGRLEAEQPKRRGRKAVAR